MIKIDIKMAIEEKYLNKIYCGNCLNFMKELPDNYVDFVITSPHPSPLSASRGFFGSRPFSRTNNFLIAKGLEPIKWVKRQM